jgi:hypothetical protein
MQLKTQLVTADSDLQLPTCDWPTFPHGAHFIALAQTTENTTSSGHIYLIHYSGF